MLLFVLLTLEKIFQIFLKDISTPEKRQTEQKRQNKSFHTSTHKHISHSYLKMRRGGKIIFPSPFFQGNKVRNLTNSSLFPLFC